MELRTAPVLLTVGGAEQVRTERLGIEDYLALYRRVGEAWRWDQRLRLAKPTLAALLAGPDISTHVMRDERGFALGFCEFDRSAFPEVELKNFGLISEVHGRGLGLRLLSCALNEEWQRRPSRIWLHTDPWDHPAAVHVYQRAGFRIYDVRDEDPDPL